MSGTPDGFMSTPQKLEMKVESKGGLIVLGGNRVSFLNYLILFFSSFG